MKLIHIHSAPMSINEQLKTLEDIFFLVLFVFLKWGFVRYLSSQCITYSRRRSARPQFGELKCTSTYAKQCPAVNRASSKTAKRQGRKKLQLVLALYA